MFAGSVLVEVLAVVLAPECFVVSAPPTTAELVRLKSAAIVVVDSSAGFVLVPLAFVAPELAAPDLVRYSVPCC